MRIRLLCVTLFVVGCSEESRRGSTDTCPAGEVVLPFANDGIGAVLSSSARYIEIDGEQDLEVCGNGTGLAPAADDHTFVHLRKVNDFDFRATVVSLSEGAAGIASRFDEQTSARARVAVVVEKVGDDYQLHSSVRLDNGVDALPPVESVNVALPIEIRIVRSGTDFTTSYASGGGGFTEHLSADAQNHDLEK